MRLTNLVYVLFLLLLISCSNNIPSKKGAFSNPKDCPFERLDWLSVTSTFDKNAVAKLSADISVAAKLDAEKLSKIGDASGSTNIGLNLEKTIKANSNAKFEVSQLFLEAYTKHRFNLCNAYKLATDKNFDSVYRRQWQQKLLEISNDFENVKNETQRQAFDKNNKLMGILVPPSFKSSNEISIDGGNISQLYPLTELRQGINWVPDMFTCTEKEPLFQMQLKLSGDTLLISTDLIDLKNNLVGKIVENTWLVKQGKIFDYDEDTAHNRWLDVIDEEGNIIRALQILEPNRIIVQGYFMNTSSVGTVTNGLRCVFKTEPHWEDSVRSIMKKAEHVSPKWQKGYKP